MAKKKLYRTSMVNVFRLIVLAIVVFFFNDFYLETFQQEKFLKLVDMASHNKFYNFWAYHFTYPAELFTFVGLIIIPGIYYAFIRGVRFQDKLVVVNRGLPFFNQKIPYEEIKTYKLMHPKHMISVHTKSGEAFVIADNQIERVIAILDQHNIPGDLAQEAFVSFFNYIRNIILFIASFVLLLFVVRKISVYFFGA